MQLVNKSERVCMRKKSQQNRDFIDNFSRGFEVCH